LFLFSLSSLSQALRDKSLAGKSAIFDVEVLEASTRTVPEVTDEFADNVRAGLTKESLMNELRKAIDEEDAKEYVGARNKALGLALAGVMDVSVPDTLVTNQAREKFAVMMAEMRDGGVSDEEIKRQINPENFGKYKDIVKDDIIRDFKVSMATDEIARLEGITVPSYQVDEQMENIKKDAAQSSEEFDEGMVRAKVETTLVRQAVMNWLADQSKLEVQYVEEKFDEALMQQLAEESLKREEEMARKAAAAKGASAVQDAEIVNDTPAVSEQAPEAATPAAEDEEAKKARYAAMSLEDRAFQALVDSGLITPSATADETGDE
jgi:FKBP-type peptidyl-prolyl cis-trans isomerase (trigger factor)